MSQKHVTILGGFGSVGIQVAQYLLAHSDVTITLAARTARDIPSDLDKAFPHRINGQVLDASSANAMQQVCSNSDLVVSCIGPSGILGDTVPQICKDNNTPLVDAGGYDPVLASLDSSELTQSSQVPLIINVGLLPGLSGMFPAHVIHSGSGEDRISQMEVQYVGRDAWTYNSAWDIINGLGDFGEERGFCFVTGGQVVKVPMRKAASKCHFPQPIGSVSTMLLYAEEMARLARQQKIETVKVFGANIGPRATLVCMMAKIFRMYRSHKSIDRAARWLVKASKKDMKKLMPAYGVQVDLQYASGKTCRGQITLEDTYQATGIVMGIAARAVLEDKGPGPGVYLLHEAIHHDWFFRQLQDTGLITFQNISTEEQPSMAGAA